jgi:hypothetical protein
LTNTERRWSLALAEHDEVVGEFCRVAAAVDPATWQTPPAPGKWSPAAVVLHVCESYEFGLEALEKGAEMQLLVPPAVAWLARTLLLPWFLNTTQFPSGARAPREVVPDLVEAHRSTPASLVDRLRESSQAAARGLRRAAGERPALRIRHAYFGALSPLLAVRLLNAHTRHHAAAFGNMARY